MHGLHAKSHAMGHFIDDTFSNSIFLRFESALVAFKRHFMGHVNKCSSFFGCFCGNVFDFLVHLHRIKKEKTVTKGTSVTVELNNKRLDENNM